MRSRAESDWQDRLFLLERVAALIRIEALDFACDVESGAPELFVARTSHFGQMAKLMRTPGVQQSRFVRRTIAA